MANMGSLGENQLTEKWLLTSHH